MRIVSGLLKARLIHSPQSSKTRPTTDKLRSAIFSILSSMEKYPNVLDAFAGTGALGIESYSRGAKYIDFIDKDISILKKNVELLGDNSYKIYKGDYFKIAGNLNKKYNLIFFDPPYNMYNEYEVTKSVADYNLLEAGGIIIYEEFYKKEFNIYEKFQIIDERRYGDTKVVFIEYSPLF